MDDLDRPTVLANLRADIEVIAGWPPIAFPELKKLSQWRLAIHFRDKDLAVWVKERLLPRELIHVLFIYDE